jgi:thymidine kinase
VVESRNPNGGGKMSAIEFKASDPWEVLGAIRDTEQKIGKRVECIAIDEGQFVDQLFLFVKYLLDAGHDVLVAGLDLDFRAMPFGEMLNLTWLVNAYGGSITECMAYCSCGARAHSTLFSPAARIRRSRDGISRLGYEQVQMTWPEIVTLPGSCKPLNWNEPEASGLTIRVPTPVGNAKI